MGVKVLIGLPVYKRAWILPLWLHAIENQTIPLSELGFIFELGTDDNETLEVLYDWHTLHPEVQIFDARINYTVEHEAHPENGRLWNENKYQKMVTLRNSLLERAVCYEPERYFSLDSDLILENKETIEYLYSLSAFMDIVSPLSYMKWDDIRFPSVMSWLDKPGGKARRIPQHYSIGEVFQADIVMAAVMMKPEVYRSTRYQVHRQGEDLGFATQATMNGFTAYCASDHYAAHVMHQSVLDIYLQRGDYRSTNNRDSIIPVRI